MELAEYAKSCSDQVEPLWQQIEQMRHDMQQRFAGFIATDRPEHRDPRIILIERVAFRNGRWWFEGPVPTKTGWHSRQRDSIHAGASNLAITRHTP